MTILDPKRRFTGAQRAALYLVADGRCANCGAELQPGWHADHKHPHSAGGPTDVTNGQALCPTCNLQKGAKHVTSELRGWQGEALAKFLSNSDDFLCVATPGAGKTRFALAAARELMQRSVIQRVIVVAPTAHLRGQWARSAKANAGIDLDDTFVNGNGAFAKDFDGVAVTYSSVASCPQLYRKLATAQKTLVILDEIHHGGEELSWGSALREAFEFTERRLLLSGTPFRSDGGVIPFVKYGEDRRCIPDYSYDYGDALADRQGVVRPIAFPAFDGEARWLDATMVESKQKLSDVDDSTRARALRSALMPTGPWISSVLKQANEQLTVERVLVPDAGGLVVAADQPKAVAYAKILEELCGEPVTVAISDVPDASQKIKDFEEGTNRWIVAVAMVAEGVDIPRLTVGVYATNTATEMFFRQVAGRFVRTRHPDDDACATLYIPSVQPLLGFAAEIERMVPQALQEAAERAAQDDGESGRVQLEIDVVQPLAPSEAVHLRTILSGDSFTEAELERAARLGREAGMPASTTPAQMARLLRIAGAGQTIATTTVELPAQTLGDQKRHIRRQLQTMVGRLNRMTGEQHSHIHSRLNQITGATVDQSTMQQLQQRLGLLGQWINEGRQ